MNEHDWEPNDSEGKEMTCSNCGVYASFYSWDWNYRVNSNCGKIQNEHEQVIVKKGFGIFQFGFLEAVFFEYDEAKEIKDEYDSVELKEIFVVVNQFDFMTNGLSDAYYDSEEEAKKAIGKVRLRKIFKENR